MPQPPPAGTPVAFIAAAIRRERREAGLTLTELARRAGVAKSTLSQLESGAGNPSVETLWAIGVALDVPFSRLVDTPTRQTRVVRADEGPVAYADQARYAATLLAACPPNARRDLYRVRVEPGPPRRSDPHQDGTGEHVVLTSGRARLGPVDAPYDLEVGDYLTYPGDVPHVFEALAPGTSAVLLIEHV